MNKIYIYISTALLALVLAGCNSEDDNLVVTQRENIDKYIESNRGKYSGEEIGEVNGVYRYRIPDPRYNGTTAARIQDGDSVYFYFAAYQFNTTRVEPAFFTNIDEIIDQYSDGINPIFFFRGIEKIEVGKGKLMKPIENSLVNCYLGDSVMLFLDKKQAFGSNYVMSLPPDSAVEYAILIEEVKKNNK